MSGFFSRLFKKNEPVEVELPETAVAALNTATEKGYKVSKIIEDTVYYKNYFIQFIVLFESGDTARLQPLIHETTTLLSKPRPTNMPVTIWSGPYQLIMFDKPKGDADWSAS